MLFNLLALMTTALADQGYFKLEPKKYRGDSFEEARIDARPQAIQLYKRDNSMRDFNMMMTNQRVFYGADIQLGSDNQTMGVLVDTGSSDLWVIESRDSRCEVGGPDAYSGAHSLPDVENTFTRSGYDDDDDTTATSTSDSSPEPSGNSTAECPPYGVFNHSSSTTYRSHHEPFEIRYGDSIFSGTHARGFLGDDTLRVGNISVERMTLAVVDDTNIDVGVLGIGPKRLEARYGDGHKTYNNFPFMLKNAGITRSASYSIFLNSVHSSTASILFGALDHNRIQSDDLHVFPMVPETDARGHHNSADRIQITLNRISVGSLNAENETEIANGYAVAGLDTGSTLSQLPLRVLDRIAGIFELSRGTFNGDWTQPYYYSECSAFSDLFITFNFQGVDIRLGMTNFIVPIVDGRGTPTGQCALAFGSSDNIILGDTFLRAMYLVVDLDHSEVALGYMEPNATAESIEVISSGIRAVSAPNYTDTYVSGGTLQVVTAATTRMSTPTATGLSNISSSLNGYADAGSIACSVNLVLVLACILCTMMIM